MIIADPNTPTAFPPTQVSERGHDEEAFPSKKNDALFAGHLVNYGNSGSSGGGGGALDPPHGLSAHTQHTERHSTNLRCPAFAGRKQGFCEGRFSVEIVGEFSYDTSSCA